jgi:hypothetical protein
VPIGLCNVWFYPSKGRAMSPTSYDELVPAERPEPSDAVLVERDEVAVMYRVIDDTPEEMGRAWVELEAAVGLRGRKFFGTFHPSTGEYRVCVQLRDGDDPDALGLKVGVLPDGRYLRLRLEGEPPAVYQRIAPSFEALMKQAAPDPGRPSIEFYRRRDVIDLLLPVR